jgi:ribosomal protein S18 acetylase RimI-like enzyme
MFSFRSIDLMRDSETIVKFRRDSYVVSFGDDRLFGDDSNYLVRIADRLEKFPGGLAIVEKDNQPVGQIEMQIREEDNQKLGYVNLFYLIPEYRGNGYGAELIDYAEDYFSKNGISEYHLRVSTSNKRGIAFYEKHGFKLLRVEEEATVLRYKMKKVIK